MGIKISTNVIMIPGCVKIELPFCAVWPNAGLQQKKTASTGMQDFNLFIITLG